MNCPCCGQTMPEKFLPLALARALPLGPRQRRLLEVLARTPNQWVTTERQIDAMYGDDRDGGPTDISNCISVVCVHLRRNIRSLGWTIAGRFGRSNGARMLITTETTMPGKKHRFTMKQDRQAAHIAASERKAGKSAKEAKSIGYATVNKNKKRRKK